MANNPLAEYPVWRGFEMAGGRALADLTRREAQAIFDRFVTDVPERGRVFRDFAAQEGGVTPEPGVIGVKSVEGWLWPWLIQLHRGGHVPQEQRSGLLHDFGVFVGCQIIGDTIGRELDLTWTLVTSGPRDLLGRHFPAVGTFPARHAHFWPVTMECVTDGYILEKQIAEGSVPLRPRVVFRYLLFSGDDAIDGIGAPQWRATTTFGD